MKPQKILSRLVWFVCFPIRHCIHRTVDEMIREAMSEKKLLVLDYDDKRRIVEPHVYGRKNDQNGILARQIGGQSATGLGWKIMYMKKMTNVKVLTETFPGKIEVSGRHFPWDLHYYIVD